MLCEHCGTRRAEIHLVKVVNGERHVQHLCRECAGELFCMDDAENLMNLSFSVIGLMGIEEAFKDIVMPALHGASENKKKSRHVCPHCGGVLPDSMFEHKGETEPETAQQKDAEDKVMTAADELAALEGKMREAVKAEDYEYAAKLRDRITELKNSNDTNGEQDI